MIKVGDMVSHSVFPPIEGIVSIVLKEGDKLKIAVLKEDNRVFWDYEDSWTVVRDAGAEYIEDVDFTEL